MVWLYDYADRTIRLVTYFPHKPAAETDGASPRYADSRPQPDQQRHLERAPIYSEFTGPTFAPDGKVLFVNTRFPELRGPYRPVGEVSGLIPARRSSSAMVRGWGFSSTAERSRTRRAAKPST